MGADNPIEKPGVIYRSDSEFHGWSPGLDDLMQDARVVVNSDSDLHAGWSQGPWIKALRKASQSLYRSDGDFFHGFDPGQSGGSQISELHISSDLTAGDSMKRCRPRCCSSGYFDCRDTSGHAG